MEDTSAYDCSNVTVLLPTEKPPCSSQVIESFWISNSSPSVQGSTSMVNLENSCGGNTADGPFVSQRNRGENGNKYDRCYHQPEKKRRLRADQAHFLETSFVAENKLGPEKKIHLANELGLEPRQIAIWYQNRRARYKTKLIENDYDSLKASYDNLKADHESLFKETEKLKSEVHLLTEKLLLREKEKAKSEPCGLINSLDAEPEKTSLNTMSQSLTRVLQVVCKQEDANSAKSDVLDSSLLEPAVSSHAYEPQDQSGFSQDEEDNLGRNLPPLPRFPKLKNEFYNDTHPNSCKLGYPVEDEALWFWT